MHYLSKHGSCILFVLLLHYVVYDNKLAQTWLIKQGMNGTLTYTVVAIDMLATSVHNHVPLNKIQIHEDYGLKSTVKIKSN